MSVQNMAFRGGGYLGVSVPVTTAAAKLTTLIEAVLGLSAGQFATTYREATFQVDPETSSTISIRFGNSNLGTTLGGVVQKGATLVGQSQTVRGPVANIPLSALYVQTVTGSGVLNCQFWDY